MKFATTKSDGLAIVQNDTLIPITGVLAKGSTMIDLIAQYEQIKGRLADLAARGGGSKLDSKLLSRRSNGRRRSGPPRETTSAAPADSMTLAAAARRPRPRRKSFWKISS